MRVYPGSSHEMDVGHSSHEVRGGAQSSLSHADIETQRNRMTLEEARWVRVRKKVPGMSGIPSQSRSRSGIWNTPKPITTSPNSPRIILLKYSMIPRNNTSGNVQQLVDLLLKHYLVILSI